MRLLIANPHGFCAGVEMAIGSLERALQLFGPPLYVFHEIVHNARVVDSFRRRGVVFVDSIGDVPRHSHVMFSAHGVSPAVREQARQRHLHTIDATCPLVTKVHREAVRYAQYGYTIVLIGHARHEEVEGTLGEAPDQTLLVESVDDVDRLDIADPTKVAFLTQTTLSLDETSHIIRRLEERFPQIVGPPSEDICYATQNRQNALKQALGDADSVLVLGSRNSSNSNRLVEMARQAGKPGYLVDSPDQINLDWFADCQTVLITAGASAPEETVIECVALLRNEYAATVEHRTHCSEHAEFPLPVELRGTAVAVSQPREDVEE